ncbi:glycosyltransferase [Antarcticibacterium arcticum]|uniref:Glycosyltransferase n=1 Tax=Antarcticibacterium arcticum TaxID=2585771 RepID=A0A5B8YPE9_9FLAO|nr:glycosyltransferase [Antarcticibacterium arcticum]QED37759.1 glycosyltransferase [Antarcticibacterium arcticum]
MVSIIIPCFNDAQYIEQAVASALAQTLQQKEIIVIDDGSNIETKAVLKNLEPKIDKLITQQNKGASAARNIGIENSKWDYIIVLDSDDYFDPSFAAKALEIISKDEQIKIVTCYANIFKEKEILKIIKPKEAELKDFLLYNCAIGNSIFRKRDFYNSGGYDEDMKDGYEDWEFYIRLLKNGGISKVIPEILFNYRQKKISNSSIARSKKYELLKYIYFKHKDLYLIHYESFVDHLVARLEVVEKTEQKILNSLEFRIGKFITNPFKMLRRRIKL